MKGLLTLALALGISSVLFVLPTRAKEKLDAETEQTILKLEQEWANAYVKGDAAALEQILADDYVFTGADGKTETKAQHVADMKSGALKMTECKLEDVKVRVYGKTAVVMALANIKGTAKGHDISGKYRFTDVLVRKRDKWQAVSTHESLISDKQ